MIAACAGLWWLFDSTDIRDHVQARAICDRCPMIAECGEIAEGLRKGSGYRQTSLEGTWAGKLYGTTARKRRAIEEAMFTEAEAREAHREWYHLSPEHRAELGDTHRLVIGERVYQRRSARRNRGAA